MNERMSRMEFLNKLAPWFGALFLTINGIPSVALAEETKEEKCTKALKSLAEALRVLNVRSSGIIKGIANIIKGIIESGFVITDIITAANFITTTDSRKLTITDPNGKSHVQDSPNVYNAANIITPAQLLYDKAAKLCTPDSLPCYNKDAAKKMTEALKKIGELMEKLSKELKAGNTKNVKLSLREAIKALRESLEHRGNLTKKPGDKCSQEDNAEAQDAETARILGEIEQRVALIDRRILFQAVFNYVNEYLRILLSSQEGQPTAHVPFFQEPGKEDVRTEANLHMAVKKAMEGVEQDKTVSTALKIVTEMHESATSLAVKPKKFNEELAGKYLQKAAEASAQFEQLMPRISWALPRGISLIGCTPPSGVRPQSPFALSP